MMISKETVDIVKNFRDERQWSRFHNPKDLAISLSLEASELLEIYQWSADDLDCNDKLEEVKEELADVMSYGILLADRYGLDLDEIIQAKMKKNAEKYPVEKASGVKTKYDKL